MGEDGTFGSVCGVSLAAADVACRQLGFAYGIPSSSPCGTYGAENLCGAPSTEVAMQDLACTGGELGLSDCTWVAPSTECQTHERDSIVYCGSSDVTTPVGSVRLLSADGAPSLTQDGLVEIFVNGEWSPVCGISPGAETLVCKALGFAGVAVSKGSAPTVGRSLRAPRLGDLRCKGSEASVLDCSFDAGDDVYCAPSEASVSSAVEEVRGGVRVLCVSSVRSPCAPRGL